MNLKFYKINYCLSKEILIKAFYKFNFSLLCFILQALLIKGKPKNLRPLYSILVKSSRIRENIFFFFEQSLRKYLAERYNTTHYH